MKLVLQKCSTTFGRVHMSQEHRRFDVYPRKFPDKAKPGEEPPIVYYARFYNDAGERVLTKSTGHKTKSRALTWAAKYAEENALPTSSDKTTFGAYSEGFFDPGGPYDKHRRGLKKRISDQQLAAKQVHLETYLIPAIGADTPLSEVSETSVSAVRAYMSDRSASTVNKALSVLKAILDAARKENLVKYVPEIERPGNRDAKQRDAFTVEEFRKIFAVPWVDFRVRTANYLAATSGARMGEILGLRFSNVQDDHIEILASWNSKTRQMNPTTKTGKPRGLPIPPAIREQLAILKNMNPYKDEVDDPFVFFAYGSADHPMEHKEVRRGLYLAIRAIGISDEERKRRDLVFHSWRHFLNSYLLNRGANKFQVMAITGHETDEMQRGYYHPDELSEISGFLEKLTSEDT